MKLTAFAVSDIGCHRSENEDSNLCEVDLGLFAVADGIGGLPGGAQASQCALATLREWFAPQAAATTLDYTAAVTAANDAVVQLGHQISPRYGIGTTLTLAHIAADKLHVLHVGDSALFRLHGGAIGVLTRDHSVKSDHAYATARGESPEPYFGNPHALTRCVGQPPPLAADHSEYALASGDRYLVCTDGITRCITPYEIQRQLAEASDAKSAAETLVALARERGGFDNATAVVLFVD
ncbi:MAG: protein phosphatase 2C domain-containing protein [Candidatus Didemnitutus sp.]|nr:protein phosphatase 2C domain-containing protein [Candidatus Didemnitutus sp.]